MSSLQLFGHCLAKFFLVPPYFESKIITSAFLNANQTTLLTPFKLENQSLAINMNVPQLNIQTQAKIDLFLI